MGLYSPGAGKTGPPTRLLPFPAPDDAPGQPHSDTPRKARRGASALSHRTQEPHARAAPTDIPQHRRRKKNLPATYLKEPVAPPVEGGDDGGMDIAAVQALGREEKREFSWKEGRKEERRRNRGGRRKGHGYCRRPGRLSTGASGPGSRAGPGSVSKKHSWETLAGRH